MGALNNTLEVNILDWFFRNASASIAQLSSTSSIGIGVAGSQPGETGVVSDQRGGTILHADATYWANASSGAITISTKTQLWEPSSAWGDVTHVFFTDSAAQTTSRLFGTLPAAYTVVPGEYFAFSAGTLTLQLGSYLTYRGRHVIFNNLIHRTITDAIPSPNIWIGLSTTLASNVNTFTEPTGGSYARAAKTSSMWGAPGGVNPTVMSNAQVVDWPVATANWGTVRSWGFFTDATDTAPNCCVAFGQLTTATAVNTDDQVFFNIGDLSVTME